MKRQIQVSMTLNVELLTGLESVPATVERVSSHISEGFGRLADPAGDLILIDALHVTLSAPWPVAVNDPANDPMTLMREMVDRIVPKKKDWED